MRDVMESLIPTQHTCNSFQVELEWNKFVQFLCTLPTQLYVSAGELLNQHINDL